MVRVRLPRSRSSARRRWGPIAVVAAAILVGSLVPLPPGRPDGVSWIGVDKIVHALAYAVFGLALAGAARSAPDRPGRARLAAGVFLAAVAFGAAIELLQAPLPWRQFALGDLLANAVGAGVAAVWTAVGPHVRRTVGRESD